MSEERPDLSKPLAAPDVWAEIRLLRDELVQARNLCIDTGKELADRSPGKTLANQLSERLHAHAGRIHDVLRDSRQRVGFGLHEEPAPLNQSDEEWPPDAEKQIADLLELFDDFSMARVMDELKLEWLCRDGDGEEEVSMRPPTRGEIRLVIQQRLREVAAMPEGDPYRPARRCVNHMLFTKTNGLLAVYFTPFYAEWTP